MGVRNIHLNSMQENDILKGYTDGSMLSINKLVRLLEQADGELHITPYMLDIVNTQNMTKFSMPPPDDVMTIRKLVAMFLSCCVKVILIGTGNPASYRDLANCYATRSCNGYRQKNTHYYQELEKAGML